MMKFSDLLGASRPNPVAEFEAEGDIERVYHEIRQCLRVTGVNLVFRTWAGFGRFLPVMWDEFRPNVLTTLFEDAAGQIREEALRTAAVFHPAETGGYAGLGESRAYQIRAALDLYHYVNPKLLILTSAVCQALQGVHIGSGVVAEAGAIQPGEPARMYPMEMEEERPEDKILRRVFKDITRTLSLPRINSDSRTLALWPDYLALAWKRLKPITRSPEFQQASEKLRDQARNLARTLPFSMALTLGRVKELGVDADWLQEVTKEFERLLPSLILNMAVLQADWKSRDETTVRPAAAISPQEGPEPAWRSFQKRQRVMELGDRFVSYIDEGAGEPVVLLHGIPTWGFLWDKLIAALKDRYRVLVPDLLGFGYSEKRDCFDRSLARQTEMVDGFLSKLEVESAHLIGHGIGGGVALRCATLLPHRIRSLCLMNSVCYDSWPAAMMLQWGLPGTRRQLPAAKALKALREAVQEGFQTIPGREWLDGLLSPWRTEVGKLSLIRNFIALNTNHTMEITRLLPAISVPTLVLWGEEDPFQLVKYGEWLAKDIPGANLVRIARARHFVMIDQPEQVQTALQEFFARQTTQVAKAA